MIFAADEPLTARIVSRADGYALESDAIRHVACRFPGEAPGEPPRCAPAFPDGQAVDGSEIYRLFFHGPAFRVVAAAEWREGSLLARLNNALPPWRRDGRAPPGAPRLLEFALQSAGLLALAEQPAMEIPRHIARIDRYLPTAETAVLFAKASRGADGIDIDLFDRDGLVHLRVAGYRTAPLPYPVGRDRMEALHQALRSGQ
jgi:hypothetical protein